MEFYSSACEYVCEKALVDIFFDTRPFMARSKFIFLLSLPNDILERVFEHLVSLHQCPKSLFCFLLTTKQLCKPRYTMYKMCVRPFLMSYRLSLMKALTIIGNAERQAMESLDTCRDDALQHLDIVSNNNIEELEQILQRVKAFRHLRSCLADKSKQLAGYLDWVDAF